MSKSTISTFELFQMFPDQESARTTMLERMPELRGKNLACWCPVGSPCHADVLLEVANHG